MPVATRTAAKISALYTLSSLPSPLVLGRHADNRIGVQVSYRLPISRAMCRFIGEVKVMRSRSLREAALEADCQAAFFDAVSESELQQVCDGEREWFRAPSSDCTTIWLLSSIYEVTAKDHKQLIQ